MPVRKRRDRRRQAELDAWREVFATGVDWDRQLSALTDDCDFLLDDAPAREAWRRLGAAFMAEWTDTQLTPWALETFGDPNAC